MDSLFWGNNKGRVIYTFYESIIYNLKICLEINYENKYHSERRTKRVPGPGYEWIFAQKHGNSHTIPGSLPGRVLRLQGLDQFRFD